MRLFGWFSNTVKLNCFFASYHETFISNFFVPGVRKNRGICVILQYALSLFPFLLPTISGSFFSRKHLVFCFFPSLAMCHASTIQSLSANSGDLAMTLVRPLFTLDPLILRQLWQLEKHMWVKEKILLNEKIKSLFIWCDKSSSKMPKMASFLKT